MAERPPRRCTMPGCERPARSRGYCSLHYQRWWRHGDAASTLLPRYAPGTICPVAECGRPVRARGWCAAHYYRVKRTGQVGTAPIGVRSSCVSLTVAAEAVRRVRLGQSRRKVAAALGISPSAVWAFARGLRRADALACVAQEAECPQRRQQPAGHHPPPAVVTR